MLKKIIHHTLSLIHKNIPSDNPTIILGLSGGPDSVFLLLVLQELHHNKEINLIAAHLDHQWRTESHKDVLFCKRLCEQYKIPFEHLQADQLDLTVKHNGSLEEIGRRLRRHYFEQLLTQHNAQFIALAHHRQDQQETFFIRLLRGSSLDGLTCMKAYDKPYLRPLININKDEIIEYLDNNKIDYLIDPSNTSDNFLRNRIRKHIIPTLSQCDERFDKKFDTTLEHLNHENEFLNKLTKQAFTNIFTHQDNALLKGDLTQFRSLDPALQKRLIVMWLIKENLQFNVSNRFVHEIIRFLTTQRGGQHKIKAQWAIKKQQSQFWIEHII